ncbi:hypothetical protein U9M48_005935 [Paspalum notatum var. saurae]|uniref:Uncharacterized protein n=1 Tax=Paspalum notatum var. saurae TaxID=547442 RepID=A0AAQ3PR60_PASNO
MLQASSERPAAGGLLWVPGMSPAGPADAGLSARAQEIARRREEMLGMLHDLPESEYELSLTDLVEKQAAAAGADGEEAAAATTAAAIAPPAVRQRAPAAGRTERRASARRRDSGSLGGGSSFRSSSDGVLLNFYMPRSLTRSFTAPRPSRTPSISGRRTPSVASECNKRERDPDAETVRCWSLLWDRRWRKSSRPDPGAPHGESAIRAASAAILKAAKHSDKA